MQSQFFSHTWHHCRRVCWLFDFVPLPQESTGIYGHLPRDVPGAKAVPVHYFRAAAAASAGGPSQAARFAH